MDIIYKVIVSLPAQLEIEEIIDWYNIQKDRSGEDFLLSFQEVLDLLTRHPFIYAKVYKEFHMALTNKYPYAIFYRVIQEEKEVEVITVIHTSRNPSIWKKRIKFYEED